MNLAIRRVFFTSYLADLLTWAMGERTPDDEPRFLLAIDQVKRTQVEADANAAGGKGITHSLHRLGLAVDILVYRMNDHGGLEYVGDGEAPEYAALGEKWESLHEDCAWGGRFTRKDSNHFSLATDGVR